MMNLRAALVCRKQGTKGKGFSLFFVVALLGATLAGCSNLAITVTDAPAAPAAPAASAGDQQLTISWAAVESATAYEVWIGTANNSGSAQKSGDDVIGVTKTIDGLANGTTYYVWVKAKNEAGASGFSPAASGTPQAAAAVPAAPAAPAVSVGDQQLTASWTAVENATAYEVWIGTEDNMGSAQKSGDDVSGITKTIDSLANGTAYYVWVKAKNGVGASGFSPSASGTPQAAATAPDAPAMPTISAGDQQLTASWTAVEGSAVYEVWLGTEDNTESANKFGDDVSDTTKTIADLANGTTYYVWVKAKNEAGASGFSPAASGTPQAELTAPNAPAAAPAVITGSQQLTASWALVESATAYELWLGTTDNTESAQKSGDDVTGATKTITDLANGTTYYVWVKAKNEAGTSGFSPSASGTPQAAATAPNAPAAAPTVTAGDRQLTVAWTAVESATAYELWLGTADNTESAQKSGDDVSGVTTTIAGLANGTAYYVWVKAKNAVGAGGFSPAASGTPIPPPTAPAAPAVTAGDRQLAISWAAVDGATAYEVWFGTADNAGSAKKSGDDVSGVTTTIAGLANGTTYYVWVKAKNSVGAGGFSPPASGTPIPPPAAPAAPAVTVGDRQLAINWTAVDGATAYEVWFGATDNTGSAQKSGDDVSGVTTTIAGLANGTAYYVWVKAKNSVGASDFSPAASGTPILLPPAAPARPTARAGDKQLAISWTAVAGATAYEVWLGTANNSENAQKSGDDVTVATKTIANLTNGDTYYVWVKAKNGAGTSDFSPSASGTPILPPPVSPAAPAVTAGNGRLELSWTAAEGATAYEVWYGESDNPAEARQFGGDVAGATTAAIAGFGKYIKHYVWVKAKNSAGTSGFSPAASGIPLGLDPRLVGVWQFAYSGGVEECTITTTTKTVDGLESLGTMEFGGSGSEGTFSDIFSGDILWAETFDDMDVLKQHMYFRPSSGRWDVVRAGVIIIKYWPGHEHSMWEPTGDYFGLYYLNLNDGGTQAALFHTSDQANSYGPTETSSLEAAKARFTIDNIKLWLSTAAGDPHIKVPPENALPRQ
jgi:hypothetical protein